MPIQCSIPIMTMTQDEFSALDYKVMQHAFDSQNSIGSLADERVYQADFATRLIHAGFHVAREVEISLSHKSFQKSLYLDHVIDRRAVYELKVVKALSDAHRGQLLTYLNLLNLERGKLINFAFQKVEAEFVNAAIPFDARRSFDVDRSCYLGPEFFINLIVELIRDWGTSLSINLYLEAVTALLGGLGKVEVMLPTKRAGIELASQRFLLASPDDAFQITAITKTNSGYASHLQRLLSISPLRQLHWVNIARHHVQFITIRNEAERSNAEK
ncbi:MAG: GxxExxY protein [Planctomycetota bacterium]|nr:GxxExxY protein [Planctomycetota bacterium]